MKKTIILAIILIVLIILLVTMLTVFRMDLSKALPHKAPVQTPVISTTTPSVVSTTTDVHAGTYILEGQAITLKDGHYEAPVAPGSAQEISVDYFGNDAVGDLNGDGVPDRVFLITMDSGGTGTFFYVVALVTDPAGNKGSEAYSIGDRIAPQTISIDKNGVITVNYADRAAGQSFADQPSVGKTLRLKLDPTTMRFGIVANDFEGEASPASMSLTMKTWNWIDVTYNDGTRIPAKDPSQFKLDFKEGGTFSASTDCNGIGGNYSISSSSLSFSDMLGTLMYCQGSQEQDFTRALSRVAGYHFTSKGELILDLAMDSGSMRFR
jgi:heat shock protein HslJ